MSAPKVVKPLTGIRKFVNIRLKRFIDGYETVMKRRFPQTYRMLQMFTTGTKAFSIDLFNYLKTSKDLALNKPVEEVSYKELLVYMKTPKDLRKMAPFLLVSTLPFSQYVTMPIAVMFPKQILSSHYWTEDQKIYFRWQDHQNKLLYYRPIFRALQGKSIIFNPASADYQACNKLFSILAGGSHPTVDHILSMSDIFSREPYGIDWTAQSHLFALCRVHGISVLPGKKIRLKNHIYFIKELDNAWVREGHDTRTLDEIKKACFQRGLNPGSLSREEMTEWLDKWFQISKQINGQSQPNDPFADLFGIQSSVELEEMSIDSKQHQRKLELDKWNILLQSSHISSPANPSTIPRANIASNESSYISV